MTTVHTALHPTEDRRDTGPRRPLPSIIIHDPRSPSKPSRFQKPTVHNHCANTCAPNTPVLQACCHTAPVQAHSAYVARSPPGLGRGSERHLPQDAAQHREMSGHTGRVEHGGGVRPHAGQEGPHPAVLVLHGLPQPQPLQVGAGPLPEGQRFHQFRGLRRLALVRGPLLNDHGGDCGRKPERTIYAPSQRLEASHKLLSQSQPEAAVCPGAARPLGSTPPAQTLALHAVHVTRALTRSVRPPTSSQSHHNLMSPYDQCV